MKNFIIWPLLVPALAFCQEETTATSTTSHKGIELDVPGTVKEENAISILPGPPHQHEDSNPDSFLQQPAPPQWHISESEGTVMTTDDTDVYLDDLYGDQYEYQDKSTVDEE